jgi:modulator of FtsH protease HflK
MSMAKIPVSPGETVEVPVKTIIAAILIFIGLYLASSMAFQVDTEEEGVVLRFGRHVKTVGPGLHFKLPYPVEQVVKVPTRVVDVLTIGFRRDRAAPTPGNVDEEASMLTGDLNIVLAGFDIQFSRVDPKDFLFNVKDPVETLRDISQSVMREIMGDRASIPILTVGRAEIQVRARELIQETVERFRMGILVNEVNLTFVSPPDQVRNAFNDLNKAEQDAVRFLEEANREYQENVPRARGQAERLVLEAEGFQERRVRTARGEADRFVKVYEAFAQAPEVTRQRMYFEALERRIPELKDVTIVDEDLSGILPLLNLNKESLQK